MKFDPTKPCTTRDGRPVRIYATDGGGTYPIHGAIKEDGGWNPQTWTAEGNLVAGTDYPDLDLINPPRPFRYEVWVNVYPSDREAVYHSTKERADDCADPNRIACVKVIVEGNEGDGL